MPEEIDEKEFPRDCTGDAVAGDVVVFTEAVFAGSFRKPKFQGERRIVARILKDSYGEAKQQHTFTLEILQSDGHNPLKPGSKTTRKGRNVYRNGTWRQVWDDENARARALEDKHARGDAARSEREIRRDWGGI